MPRLDARSLGDTPNPLPAAYRPLGSARYADLDPWVELTTYQPAANETVVQTVDRGVGGGTVRWWAYPDDPAGGPNWYPGTPPALVLDPALYGLPVCPTVLAPAQEVMRRQVMANPPVNGVLYEDLTQVAAYRMRDLAAGRGTVWNGGYLWPSLVPTPTTVGTIQLGYGSPPLPRPAEGTFYANVMACGDDVGPPPPPPPPPPTGTGTGSGSGSGSSSTSTMPPAPNCTPAGDCAGIVEQVIAEATALYRQGGSVTMPGNPTAAMDLDVLDIARALADLRRVARVTSTEDADGIAAVLAALQQHALGDLVQSVIDLYEQLQGLLSIARASTIGDVAGIAQVAAELGIEPPPPPTALAAAPADDTMGVPDQGQPFTVASGQALPRPAPLSLAALNPAIPGYGEGTGAGAGVGSSGGPAGTSGGAMTTIPPASGGGHYNPFACPPGVAEDDGRDRGHGRGCGPNWLAWLTGPAGDRYSRELGDYLGPEVRAIIDTTDAPTLVERAVNRLIDVTLIPIQRP